MKKISYILAAAIGVLAFSSCCADKEPIYQRPAENSMVLNVPAMQDQYIDLTEGDYLELTTSQPDYGYSAVANYGAQVSLTEDFSVYENVDVLNTNVAAMQMKQESIAVAYCALKGVENPDQWDEMFPEGVPYETLYFRATCELSGVTGSYIASNVVTYNHVKPYFAVPTPGYIYLVGSISKENNWNINPGPEMRLYEPDNNIGCHIYSGVFDVQEGEVYFRFYTEIGDWGNDGSLPSIGPNANDGDNTEVIFEDGSYTSPAVPGKGSWYMPDWGGGEITMVVDLSDPNNMRVTFYAGEQEIFVPESIYYMGTLTTPTWIEPSPANASAYEPYKLSTTKNAPNVYSGTIYVDADHLDTYIRFIYEFAGWDAGQWGYQADDVSKLFDMTDGSFTGAYVPGKGAWQFQFTEPGYLGVAVDKDTQEVTFTFEPGDAPE